MRGNGMGWLAQLRRRGRRWPSRVAVAAVLTAIVTTAGTALVATSGPAAASTSDPAAASASASGFAVPDLFNLSALQLPAENSSRQLYQGGIYSATAAQISSLQALEQTAVTDTIKDHGLSATDAAAVQSWGRDDADGELWALLVQAIQTPAAQRTTDQQNAVGWLTAVLQREGVLAADDAGLQYTEWAGLGISAYKNLLATSPTQTQLQAFLSGTPVNYTDGGNANHPKASTDGGYCVYQAPAPDQSQYTANVFTPPLQSTAPQTCYTPCTNPLGCSPPTPTFSDFTQWGDADVNDALFNNTAFASAAASIALGSSLAATTVGVTSSAAGVGTTFALAPVLAGTAFQTAVFPFSAAVSSTEVSAAVAAAEAAGESGAEAAAAVAEATAESAGFIAASAVGIIVAAVIFAVVAAVVVGIQVAQDLALPGQIASLIANAPSSTPDLASMLTDSNQMQGLYSLFVGATKPALTYNSCDNSQLIGPAGQPLTPCMNAPSVPPRLGSDPQFVVTPKGSTTSATQPTLTWYDQHSAQSITGYLSGNWFVDTTTPPGLPAATVQTLRIKYTDWAGNEKTAWLFGGFSKPMFLTVSDSALGASFDSATCISDGACAWTPTIDVTDSVGKDYSVGVSPGTPTPSPPPLNPQAAARPLPRR